MEIYNSKPDITGGKFTDIKLKTNEHRNENDTLRNINNFKCSPLKIIRFGLWHKLIYQYRRHSLISYLLFLRIYIGQYFVGINELTMKINLVVNIFRHNYAVAKFTLYLFWLFRIIHSCGFSIWSWQQYRMHRMQSFNLFKS